MSKPKNSSTSTIINNKTKQNVSKDNDFIDFKTIPQRFSCNSTESLFSGLQHLEDYGYVVISDVLNNEEIKQSKDLIWQFLEGINNIGIDRNNIDTWNNWIGHTESGIIHSNGIGNSQVQWFIRQIPNIKLIFQQIWNDKKLLVSMDGIGLFRPWHLQTNNINNNNNVVKNSDQKTNKNNNNNTMNNSISWKTQTGNWHIDQNPVLKPNKCCVQGIINLLPANATTGGLCVIPKSHLRFKELNSLGLVTSQKDSIKISMDCKIMQESMGLLVQAEPGDLLLFDSRTIHCNTSSLVTPSQVSSTHNNITSSNKPSLLRMVSYICMAPLSFSNNPEELITKRWDAYINRYTTSHWPYSCDLISSGAESKKNSTTQLTQEQIDLITGTHTDIEQSPEQQNININSNSDK